MTRYVAFSTVRVPPRFVVRDLRPADAFHAPLVSPQLPPDALTIDLVSGGSFGTGAHPTTQLCLTAMAELVSPVSSVLDLGCGSGVLAIGAARLEAGRIIAVDIDQAAVIRTRDNAQLNSVAAKIDIRLGSTGIAQAEGPFDVIAANLLTPIILKLAPDLPGLLALNGRLVLSGVLTTQADRIKDGLAAVGLRCLETRTLSGWCCLIVGAI